MLHFKKNKISIYMKNNFFENDLQRRKERKYGKKIRERVKNVDKRGSKVGV